MHKGYVWGLLVCQSVSYGLIVYRNLAFEELVPIFVDLLSNLTGLIITCTNSVHITIVRVFITNNVSISGYNI